MPRVVSLIGAIVAAASACGITGNDDDELSVSLSAEVTSAGGPVDFTFHNGSTRTVITGLLSCAVSFEIQAGGEWQPLGLTRDCPDVALEHPARTAQSFSTVAPDSAGTLRLVIRTWFEPGPERPITVVRSGAFRVETLLPQAE